MEKVQTNSRPNYALPIAIMFALFFMIAFVTGYQNPLGSVIEAKSGNNAVMSQLPTFANFLAYLCMGLPAGMILQKRGYRISSMLAVTVGFVGVFISYLSGYITNNDTTAIIVYVIGAFISGFAMCMLNTIVNPMLNSLGRDDKQGNQLVQFGGTCNSLGATLAPTVVGLLMGNQATNIADANPVFFLAMGIFVLAFVVLYFSKLPESPTLGQKQEKIAVSGAFKYSNFTLGVIAIFMYMGIEIGVSNFTLQYLTKGVEVGGLGVQMSVAGAIVGVYWLLMLVGRFIGGLVGGKISSRVMLAAVASLLVILLLLAIFLPKDIIVSVPGFSSGANGFEFISTQVPISILMLILCGLGTSVMWGAIFNLSVSGLGKYTQVASGIFMVMVVGGGIWPVVQGAIANAADYVTSFWLVVVCTAYQLFYALIGSRTKNNA